MSSKPTAAPKVPDGLTEQGRQFFKDVCAEFIMDSPHHLELLRAAAEQLSRAEEARGMICEHGVLMADRFGQLKPNPAVEAERQAHGMFLRLCRELNLDGAAVVESRPPRGPRYEKG